MTIDETKVNFDNLSEEILQLITLDKSSDFNGKKSVKKIVYENVQNYGKYSADKKYKAGAIVTYNNTLTYIALVDNENVALTDETTWKLVELESKKMNVTHLFNFDPTDMTVHAGTTFFDSITKLETGKYRLTFLADKKPTNDRYIVKFYNNNYGNDSDHYDDKYSKKITDRTLDYCDIETFSYKNDVFEDAQNLFGIIMEVN